MAENDGVSTLPNGSAVVSSPPDLPADIKGAISLSLVQIIQDGVMAHENFILINKMLDLDYMATKHLIDPIEALGVRMTSKEVVTGSQPVVSTTTVTKP